MATGRGAGLVRGDALAIPLGDATVDLVVTSPPYFALRSYRDGGEHYGGQIGSEPTPTAFLEALWAVTAECWRVLKPGGSMFVNLGDKYAGSGGHNNGGIAKPDAKRKGWDAENNPMETTANATRRTAPDRYNKASDGIRAKSLMGLPARYAAGCVDGLADPCIKAHEHVGRHPAYLPSEACRGRGWINRAELVWSKPNGLPESVKDRVRRSHEQFFHFTKEGDYYADLTDIRPPAATSNPDDPSYRANKSNKRRKGLAAPPGQSVPSLHSADRAATAATVLPSSVWTIATQPLIVPAHLEVDHFAAFPTEWPRRLILGWSPLGGIVFDPFGGTGTTAMCARALGRFGVSMDMSADYQRLARWRIFESGGAAKVAARTDRERQAELFPT